MLPTREKAEQLLIEAEKCNPGPWGNHSRIAAMCAEKIASFCDDLDSDKAYILGLLHDIGRKFGIKHLCHVYDGWQYMSDLGYDEVARVCLSHSFCLKSIDTYVGNVDVSDEQLTVIFNVLNNVEYDDYDRLIQLCDCLAGSECVLDMEERMMDVKKRYGFYPQDKWNKNMELKAYFETKTKMNIYDAVK